MFLNKIEIEIAPTTQNRSKFLSAGYEQQFFIMSIAVQFPLFHIGRWQGDKARYFGTLKNIFDLRRTAVVYTLHILIRLFEHNPALLGSIAATA